MKVENIRDSDAPQIALNWSWYVDTKGTENWVVSSAINFFLETTIGARHLKKVHSKSGDWRQESQRNKKKMD